MSSTVTSCPNNNNTTSKPIDNLRGCVNYPWYSCKTINDIEDILCYTKPGDNAANWRIALPEELILPTIKWYHQGTGHPGSNRLYKQLKQRYYHRDLRWVADNLNCDFCQRNKLDGKGYGFLPEHEVCSIPFEECAVDLIGPWIVQVRGTPHQFEVLTAIDTVTNLVEIVKIDSKDSDHIARKFDLLPMATTLHTWPWWRIHWSQVPNTIGKLSHQRFLYYS